MLSMTMMDDYMDKQIDQYCTFETNAFADPNQSREKTMVGNETRTTANFSPMQDESTDHSFQHMISGVYRPPSMFNLKEKKTVTDKNDIDDIDRIIEEKAKRISQDMH